MSLEIERKFLVKDDSWKITMKGVFYKQGYLFLSKEKSVRVRIAGDTGYISVKGSRSGITRDEFEYEIPLADAESLLRDYCPDNLIEKNRYQVLYAGKTWEIDEFFGKNKGLVVAEIELDDAEETFEKPAWLGDEVSDDPRYYNASLVGFPYSEWK